MGSWVEAERRVFFLHSKKKVPPGLWPGGAVKNERSKKREAFTEKRLNKYIPPGEFESPFSP